MICGVNNMKLRVKVQDIRQLTQEQQDKLKSLWLPRIGDTVNYIYDEGVMFVNGYMGDYNIVLFRGNERIRVAKNDCLPLLNIGQMIEMLKEHDKFDCIPSMRHEHYDGSSFIDVGIYTRKNGYISTENFVNNIPCDELCDVLWAVLKMVL